MNVMSGNENTNGYDGRSVANYILDICDQDGLKLTNLSLQKVIYFCHVWALLKLRRPLIAQPFEAWDYGPVLPYLYQAFKSNAAQPIQNRATKLNILTGDQQKATYESMDREILLLVKDIANIYARIPTSELVKLSHVEGGPWHRAWSSTGSINPGMRIETAAILEYYSQAPSSSKL